MAKTPAGTLTPLAIAVLGLLEERSMHPYELYQLLIARREDRLVKVRPGSLYHTVARLTDQNLVRPHEAEREGNRPERTVYDITDCGRQAMRNRISELLGTPEREYPNFPVALAEAHNLPKDEVTRLLERRIAAHELDIRELTALEQWAVEHTMPRRYWIEVQYTRTMLTAEVDWLRGMLDELATGALPWQFFSETGGRAPQPDHPHLPNQYPHDVSTDEPHDVGKTTPEHH